MQHYKLPSADAAVLTISSTAISLEDAIAAAYGSKYKLPTHLNAIDFQVTGEDIAVRWDGHDPTATDGLLVGQNNDTKAMSERGVDLGKMKMIRTGSSDATVNIQIGQINYK